MTLKEEFEQAFNYKIGSAKDDWDSIIQVDAEGLWEWIEQKVSRVELPVIVKTAEEIKEKYPCSLGCSVEMEDGLSYEQVLQANAYRLEGAMWATGNKSSFSE